MSMIQKITIRKYQETDCETISALFYDTIHAVNAKDYNEEQLYAWAKDVKQLQNRRSDLSQQNTLIAEINGITVGFGSITKSGCLDLLFVRKNFQGQGIATALCDELEKGFSTVKTYASVTALPFFTKRGYAVIKEQEVKRFGIKLKNYEMQKVL